MYFLYISRITFVCSKNFCFFSCVTEDVQQQHQVLEYIGFQRGTLPIKYLGLPLFSTQLSHKDCRPFIMKIHNRIGSWTSKFLDHAGRLQLMKVILFGIQSFWSVHLSLPVSVWKNLQSLFTKFLWGGSASNSKQAKVAWHGCYLPKAEVVWDFVTYVNGVKLLFYFICGELYNLIISH